MVTTASSRRRGGALVTVLALLVLATALTVGTFAASRSTARGVAAARAAARADAAARRALASTLMEWDGSLDSLATGISVERPASAADSSLPPLIVTARVRKLAGRIYLVLVDARVGVGTPVMARRRYRLLVERSSAVDSARRETPSRIGGWALDETN